MQREGSREHLSHTDDRVEARRSFFRWMGLGLVSPLGAALPASAGNGISAPTGDPFGGASWQDPDPVASDLKQAWKRARALGKPMLVAVIPYERGAIGEYVFGLEEGEKPPVWPAWPPYSERGARLGRALRLADDRMLAAIGATEFVCADRVELEALIRDVRRPGDRTGSAKLELPDAAMLLVDRDGSVRVVVDEIPDREVEAGGARIGMNAEQMAALRKSSIEATRELGAAIERALFEDGATSSRRLAQHVAALGESRVDFETAATGSDADVLRCGLLYHFRSRQHADEEERAKFRKRLADLTRRHVVESDFVGARWGSHGGCGSDYVHPRKEDNLNGMGIACGMGFVADVDRKYLAFRVR